mmetsp:Transcript_9580/g.25609  ORF Transcript_9580/g.25609 Transcript_9580/m.25609 type:complete len:215 (-) Transcript_9580:898-1542(-)
MRLLFPPHQTLHRRALVRVQRDQLLDQQQRHHVVSRALEQRHARVPARQNLSHRRAVQHRRVHAQHIHRISARHHITHALHSELQRALQNLRLVHAQPRLLVLVLMLGLLLAPLFAALLAALLAAFCLRKISRARFLGGIQSDSGAICHDSCRCLARCRRSCRGARMYDGLKWMTAKRLAEAGSVRAEKRLKLVVRVYFGGLSAKERIERECNG